MLNDTECPTGTGTRLLRKRAVQYRIWNVTKTESLDITDGALLPLTPAVCFQQEGRTREKMTSPYTFLSFLQAFPMSMSYSRVFLKFISSLRIWKDQNFN